MQHLMRSTAPAPSPARGGSLANARASHPAGTARAATPARPIGTPSATASVNTGAATPAELTETPQLVAVGSRPRTDEEGSLVTEYGLLAVVAATIAGVVMTWASGGALVTLFNALLRQARSLVGA
jgi:Flp pilus assembly pilin Flp